MSTSSRLLALLSLLQAPRPWSGTELAERLEISRRTVRRDVERLRDLGYPVEATMGVEGGYRLVAGAAMPPLLLDDDEAAAVAFGLRAAAGSAIEGIDETSIRALAKLEQVLPSRLRHRVASLSAATVPLPGFGPTVDPETLTLLARTIANRERVRFAYQAADGSTTRRTVEPNRLVAKGRHWYLLAFDDDRDDWRIFRVDRVTEPWSMGGRTPLRELPAADAAAYVAGRLMAGVPLFQAVVTFDAPIARVAPSLGDGLGALETIDDRRCRLTSGADTMEWLALRLMLVGCDFEVHSPPELIAYLREVAGRVTRATAAAG
jgi:biotin operon repressor BirA-like protein